MRQNISPHLAEKLEKHGVTKEQKYFEWMINEFPERINIYAEGDSWFGYPKKNLIIGDPSNILAWICNDMRGDINMLRHESNGDEIMEMVYGDQKLKTFEVLERSGNNIDYILLSGGGNDIVGEYDMNFILKPGQYIDGASAESLIDKVRFERKLESVRNAYIDFMDIRNDFAPEANIITHMYDIPTASSEGVHLFGGIVGDWYETKSWMSPYLSDRGIPFDKQNEIILYLLSSFGKTIKNIESLPQANGKFHVLGTQGTLEAGNEDDWRDEIHPSPAGFRKIASLFIDKIKELSSAI